MLSHCEAQHIEREKGTYSQWKQGRYPEKVDIWARLCRRSRFKYVRKREGEGASDKGMAWEIFGVRSVWLQLGRHKGAY